MTTLVMFSGGLDSMAMLWGMNYPVRAHFINKTPDQTLGCERRAVVAALSYMQLQGRTITFSESFVVMTPGQFFIDPLNTAAGQICQLDPTITEVAVGLNADDNYPGMAARIAAANLIFQGLAPGVTKTYPVQAMTKLQLYQSLPPELQAIFWSCRRAGYTDTHYYQDNVCSACEQLAAQGIPHPVYPK